MTLNDLIVPQFNEWDFDIYDYNGEFIIGSYERDEDDEEWTDFLIHFGDNKVLNVTPAEVLSFMGVHTDINKNLQ